MATTDQILAVILALPAWYQDAGESPDARIELLRPVAQVIAIASEGEPTRAAAMIAAGYHESRFARYVVEGRCSDGPRGARCDDGRATSPWQVWAVACPGAHSFPAGSRHSLEAAASCADRLLRGGYGRCRGRHPGGDWAGMFAAYAGGARCDAGWAVPRAHTMGAALLRLEGAR